jgi:hypothetical protein
MTHRVIQIPGGTTRFENRPQVTFAGGGNTSVSVTVIYRATERTQDVPPTLGEIVFADVLEFRWIEHDVSYEQYTEHEEDYAFGLIEILDSVYIETMAARGGGRDYVGERIRGQPENLVRHFRFSADEWGSLNIIATKISIRQLGESH